MIRKKQPSMSAAVFGALAHLVAGGKLVGRRTFPHPMRYFLVKDLESLVESATPEVSVAAVARMSTQAWANPHSCGPASAPWDVIDYRLTEKGKTAYFVEENKKAIAVVRGTE